MTECTHLKQLLLTDDLTLIRYYWTRVFETCQGTVCTEPLQLQCLKCAHLLVRGTTISCPECRAHVELCFHTAAIHLYCTGCQDIVYDPEFDAARCHAMISAGNNTRMYFEPGVGLRGMCNLGNTCYMNAVLQVLVHQPIFRDYFIHQKHSIKCPFRKTISNRATTLQLKISLDGLVENVRMSPPLKKKKKSGGVVERWVDERDGNFLARYACVWSRPWAPTLKTIFNDKEDTILDNATLCTGCISCEFEIMTCDLFCGPNASQPVALNHFLYSIWQHSSWLSGYMQQDAHEFFSFLINKLCSDDSKNAKTKCECIAHQIMGGMICSQIQCKACGSLSESFEPFFDLSLQIPPPEKEKVGESDSKDRPFSPRKRHVLSRGLSFNAPPMSLQTMLEKFLSPEVLSAAILCESCKARHEGSSKRLRIVNLPPVICFHIKRFIPGTTTANAQKSDQIITFPLRGLDMSQYSEDQALNTLLYDLCAVIQHTGSMHSGHYFCFILHHENWYKCDDVFIRRVFENEVETSQAYMLFYSKRTS